jgi:hypothetical protein
VVITFVPILGIRVVVLVAFVSIYFNGPLRDILQSEASATVLDVRSPVTVIVVPPVVCVVIIPCIQLADGAASDTTITYIPTEKLVLGGIVNVFADVPGVIDVLLVVDVDGDVVTFLYVSTKATSASEAVAAFSISVLTALT